MHAYSGAIAPFIVYVSLQETDIFDRVWTANETQTT
jgi:hypothetical protein